MPNYKLTYFNGRGRAELTRWLFEVGQISYEDKRITNEEWKEMKASTPFGALPILEVDGVVTCQSNTIARFVAKKIGLAGKDDLEQARANMIVDCTEDMVKPILSIVFGEDAAKAAAKKKFEEEQRDKFLGYFEKFLADNKTGYMVGDKLTWADLAVVIGLTWVAMVGPIDYTNIPLLKALTDKVNSQPNIAAWIKKRPETSF